jgi:hypothetical protein
MNPQPDPSIPNANIVHQRVKAAVKAHRLKLRVLTTIAFVLGFAAIITSLLVVWSYPVFVLPRQKELGAMNLRDQFNTNGIASASRHYSEEQIARLLVNHVETSKITTAGTVVVALAVGLLGFGTLTLLAVVILNRRVALNQINSSLAEISGQLRELQQQRGGGMPKLEPDEPQAP